LKNIELFLGNQSAQTFKKLGLNTTPAGARGLRTDRHEIGHTQRGAAESEFPPIGAGIAEI
jgi:hypothetical protein